MLGSLLLCRNHNNNGLDSYLSFLRYIFFMVCILYFFIYVWILQKSTGADDSDSVCGED